MSIIFKSTFIFILIFNSYCFSMVFKKPINKENYERIKLLKRLHNKSIISEKIETDLQEIVYQSVSSQFEPKNQSNRKRLKRKYESIEYFEDSLVDINNGFCPLTPKFDQEIANYIATCVKNDIITNANKEFASDYLYCATLSNKSLEKIINFLISESKRLDLSAEKLILIDYFILKINKIIKKQSSIN